MNDYQKFIAISRYARWIDEENRRETWEETVQRYVDYITEKVFLEIDKYRHLSNAAPLFWRLSSIAAKKKV